MASRLACSLAYSPTADRPITTKRRRRRNIIWFNPPFSHSVSTNIGKKFFNIIKEVFPKNHILSKIFNRNSIKLSYSCMNNVKSIIDNHNRALLNKKDNNPTTRECNCRDRNTCPMNGKCLKKSIVYQATITSDLENTETYIGLTENTFKMRYANHKASFTHRAKKSATELSKHIWDLKDRNIEYNISWNIICHVPTTSIDRHRCGLCLAEKYYIIFQPSMSTLNTRRELVTTCRHNSKFSLAKL